jgi:hypothetical protein
MRRYTAACLVTLIDEGALLQELPKSRVHEYATDFI